MKNQGKSYIGIGVEADILPYLSGGYHGSLWYGFGQIRGRAIAAKTNVPRIVTPTGFKDNNIQVYALIGDYFIASNNFDKIWIAMGAEYWFGSVTSDLTDSTANYTSYVLTGGAGYVWKLWKDLYINPWIGLHAIVGGDALVNVGNEEYKPPFITPEISLKIGWHFRIKQNAKWYMKTKKKH